MFGGIEVALSTHNEIMEVYESEIEEKTKLVVSKFGPMALYSGLNGFQIEKHPCSDIICLEKAVKKRAVSKR